MTKDYARQVCLPRPDETVCNKYSVLVNQEKQRYTFICKTCSDIIDDYVNWGGHSKREAELIRNLQGRLARQGDHLIRRDSEEEQIYHAGMRETHGRETILDILEEDDAMLAQGHSDNYGDRE